MLHNNKFNGLRFGKSKFEGKKNNCYTYAINQHVNPYTHKPYTNYDDVQPGMLGGHNNAHRPIYIYEGYENFLPYIKADLLPLGLEIIPSTYEEYVDDPQAWKIAYCYGFDDYHFYRQNKNGTWSHQKGCGGNVYRTDHNGRTIHNPQTCDRGKYEHFVGFFIIRPIRN